jgi:hypothetical protein
MIFTENRFNNMKYRKSQIEIVGLLIIVLMISFIILFAIISFKKPSNVGESIKKENLASDMISAMLHTSTNCTAYYPDMTDILTQCVKWRNSGSNVAACTNGQSYCEFFKSTAKKMFDETFVIWSTSYEMIIIPPNGDFKVKDTWLMNFTGGNFSETDNTLVASGTQPLSIGGYGNLNIRLCIGGKCGN